MNLDAEALITGVHDSDFGFLGEHQDAWYTFVGERVEMGADTLMMRVTYYDEDQQIPWNCWVVWDAELQQHDRAHVIFLQCAGVFLPADADEALSIPEGYEQVPFFALNSTPQDVGAVAVQKVQKVVESLQEQDRRQPR